MNGAGARSAGLDRSRLSAPDTLADGSLGRRLRTKTRSRDLAENRPARAVPPGTFADLGQSSAGTGFPSGGVPPAGGTGDEPGTPGTEAPLAARPKTAW